MDEAIRPVINDFMFRFEEGFNHQTGLAAPKLSYIRALYPLVLINFSHLVRTHKLIPTPHLQPIDMAREKVKSGVNVPRMIDFAHESSFLSSDVAHAAAVKFHNAQLSTSEFDIVTGTLMNCTVNDRNGPIQEEVIDQIKLGKEIPASCISCKLGLNLYRKTERGTKVRCPLLFEILRKVIPEFSFSLKTNQPETADLPLFDGLTHRPNESQPPHGNTQDRPHHPMDFVPKHTQRASLRNIKFANNYLHGKDEYISLKQELPADQEVLNKYIRYQSQGLVTMFNVAFRSLATNNRLPTFKEFSKFFPSGIGEEEQKMWLALNQISDNRAAMNNTLSFKQELWKAFRLWKSRFQFKNNLFTNYDDLWNSEDSDNFAVSLLNGLSKDVDRHFANESQALNDLFEVQESLRNLTQLRFENDPFASNLLIRPTTVAFLVLPEQGMRFQVTFKPAQLIYNDSSQIVLKDDFFYPKEPDNENKGERLMRFVKESIINMYLTDTYSKKKPPKKPFYAFYPDQLDPGHVCTQVRRISKNGEFRYFKYPNLRAEREELAEELIETLIFYRKNSEYIIKRNPAEYFEELLEP